MKKGDKEKEQINVFKEDGEEERRFDTHFDVLGELIKVRNLVGYLNEDYGLAKLSKDEKEYITNTITNILFVKELMDKLHKRGFRYGWEENGLPMKNDDGSYKKLPLEEKEKQKLREMSNQVVEMFLARSHAIAILARNSPDNFVMKMFGRFEEEEKKIEYGEEEKSAVDKIKDFFSGKKKEDEEEEHD